MSLHPIIKPRCSVPDCARPRVAKGYCDLHYRRMRTYGSTSEPPRRWASPEKRFWPQVDKNGPLRPDGTRCWLWGGWMSPLGYGMFSFDGNTRGAHRYAYVSAKGPIPKGLHIDHLCRNRACVNPDHLEAVPQRVNIMRGDGVSAKNAAKTHCHNGHPFRRLGTDFKIEKNRRRRGRRCLHCLRARSKGRHADV